VITDIEASVKYSYESDFHLAESMLNDMKMRLVTLLQYNLAPAKWETSDPAVTSVNGSFISNDI